MALILIVIPVCMGIRLDLEVDTAEREFFSQVKVKSNEFTDVSLFVD